MPSYGSNDGYGQQFLSERPSISTYHSPGSRRPPAASSLSSERVEQRYNTLLDAFLTEDRRRRGYIPLDRAVEIYNLYFHSSVGGLTGRELDLGGPLSRKVRQVRTMGRACLMRRLRDRLIGAFG